MSTICKLGPKLALCCVVCGLCLVGWAGRFSIAQSGGQDSPPPAKAEEPKVAAPQAKPDVPKAEPELPKAETAAPVLGPVFSDALLLPRETDGPAREPSLKPVDPPAPAPVVVGPDHSPLEAEDPEKVANDFLEHNHKFAEAQLKALKEEAEKIKARLAKVEAGIKRWDRLVEALKQSGATADTKRAFTRVVTNDPADETPAGRDDVTPKSSPRPDQPEPSERPQSKPADGPGDLVPR